MRQILAGILAGLAAASAVGILLMFASPVKAGLYQRQLLEEVRDIMRLDVCFKARPNAKHIRSSRIWAAAVRRQLECDKLLEENLQ